MIRTIHNAILKDVVTFVRTSAETGGTVSELHVTLMPSGGTPLHYHTSYRETFRVLSGHLGLELAGGRKVLLDAGDVHEVGVGVVHRFYNPTETPVAFVTLVVPGHEGFENSLRIVYGLAQDGLCNAKGIPKSVRHLALFATMSDTRFVGWMALLSPFLKLVAAQNVKSGLEETLIQRYCR